MLTKVKRGWELPESAATPESLFLNRRQVLKAMGVGGVGASVAIGGALTPDFAAAATESEDPSTGLYPAKRNPHYTLDRPITPEKWATTYNNFYEFGSNKQIDKRAQDLAIRPWNVAFDGMVEKAFEIGIDDLLRTMPLEERLYRHRCVEAWAMAVPYSGFAMKAMVDFAKPLDGVKYVRMETFLDSTMAPGQRSFWYPWPYVEGLTIEEATNQLAFIATGLYGKPIPKQNGAPLRLAVPWKYGFKHIKSIVRFTFTDERPVGFWEEVQGKEYGFWANVNPKTPHPRWSQATERLLGEDGRVPTLLYNGYEEFVADLYKGMEGERLFM